MSSAASWGAAPGGASARELRMAEAWRQRIEAEYVSATTISGPRPPAWGLLASKHDVEVNTLKDTYRLDFGGGSTVVGQWSTFPGMAPGEISRQHPKTIKSGIYHFHTGISYHFGISENRVRGRS
jgi:hypothetical protein